MKKDEKNICEYCGRELKTDFEYKDHYEDFVLLKDKFGKKINYDITSICFWTKNNFLRDKDDIERRLDCYLKWENVPDNIKSVVEEKCRYVIKKIQEAEITAKNIVNQHTALECACLFSEIKRHSAYPGTPPQGYEDGKLLEIWNKDNRFKNGFEFMLNEN